LLDDSGSDSENDNEENANGDADTDGDSSSLSEAARLFASVEALVPACVLAGLRPLALCADRARLRSGREALALRRYLLCWSLLLDLFPALPHASRLLISAWLRDLGGRSSAVAAHAAHALSAVASPTAAEALGDSLLSPKSHRGGTRASAHDLLACLLSESVEHLLVTRRDPHVHAFLSGVGGDIVGALPSPIAAHFLRATAADADKVTNQTPRLRAYLASPVSAARRGSDSDAEEEEEEQDESDDDELEPRDVRLYFGPLAASLYGRALNAFPALARLWLAACDRAAAAAVGKFTAQLFSPALIRRQIDLVRHAAASTADEDMTVRGNVHTSEVLAEYTKDEIRVTLRLRLPPAFPLQAVEIAFAQKDGIEEGRARRWLLTVGAMINSQNADIGAALQTWRQSVNKLFEGVEECPICYSVLHPANASLPKMHCRTCKNKFHANCLYAIERSALPFRLHLDIVFFFLPPCPRLFTF
jgi:hypothetical protein